MKKTLTSLLVGTACLIGSLAQAQVVVNSTETFDAVPPVTSWSTRSVPGAGGAPVTLVDLEAMVQTNTAALINTVLGTSSTTPPSANAIARQNSTGKYAQTFPTGNAATLLMATITNNTGANLPTPKISYDFLVPSAVVNEDPETAGHIVFYSLTGAENSWVKIPEFSSAQPTPEAGSLSLDLSLGSWPAGSRLYLLWVDDNGGPGTDGSFAIDNFTVIGDLPPPPTIATQPSNTNNIVRRTVSLSVTANGVGIQYVWNKVGVGAIDPAINPSAATHTLVITNAQESDTGDYFVSVSSPYGSVDSTSAHIQIDPDTFPPRLLAARLGTAANQFILIVDEELCNDGAACGTVFTDLPILTFIISNVNDENETLGVVEATSQNVTNIILTTEGNWEAGKAYRITITHDNNGISDLGGIVVPAGTYVDTLPTISFQQGVAEYTGTQDAGIHSGSAGTADGANPIINVDTDDGGVRQALLRFDSIFGANAGMQIPSGALIRSATLTINQTDNGNPVNFHRMLVGWDQSSVTWDSLTGGLTADGAEATTVPDAVTPGLNGVVGLITMDVTASVQAWAGGQPNYGWAIIPTGGDGWRWNSSESTVAPILSVVYEIVPCNGVPTITANPPATASVNEGSGISIAVGVGNTCSSTTFEWLKGALPGTVVPGAVSSTLTISGAVPADAGTYRLRATNPDGPVTSEPVNVTVVPDTTRPVLTRAIGPNNTTIVLTFSKTLGAGANATSHYALSGGATVTAATVANATVTLTTSARAAGSSTLTITGVTDNRVGANLINPNPTTVALTTVQVIDSYASTWSYNTGNLDANPDWTTTGGEGWQEGGGLFGTETTAATITSFPTPIVTVVPPATAANEFLTSYYRKTVNFPPLAVGMSYALSYIIDDGAVFYLDGVEIGRYNMPSGPVTYLTVTPGAGTEGVQFALPLTVTAGNHTIAVSVHQNANTSTDTVFGAQVIAIPTASPVLGIAKSGTNTVVSWNGDSSWELIGSPNVAGPYTAIAGAPFRTFSFPTPSAQTNEFYQLRYRP